MCVTPLVCQGEEKMPLSTFPFSSSPLMFTIYTDTEHETWKDAGSW